MSTVCLCMIVKNESHVIERCLRSVLAAGIDYWVIADTGSTDDTPAKILETLKDVPGELYHHEWIDFAANRNLVFERAFNRADWIIWIDADGTLVGTTRNLPEPTEGVPEGFAIRLTIVDTTYVMFRIFRGDLCWEFEHEIHEHVKAYEGRRYGFYADLEDASYPDGARSKNPNKWLDDAKVIEKMPLTGRNLLLLGQSYREAELMDSAREAFLRCAAVSVNDEEKWMATLYAARCGGAIGVGDTFAELLAAYDMRPQRAEPLVDLARVCRVTERWGLALLFAGAAARLRPPTREMLAVEKLCYTHHALEELATAAGMLGLLKTARAALEEALSRELPEDARERCLQNIRKLEEPEAKGGGRDD